MAAAAAIPNVARLIDDKINRTLSKIGRTTSGLVGTFTNLDRTITGLAFRMTLFTGLVAAPFLALKSAITSADQQYTSMLSGAAGLVAGSTNSFQLGISKMEHYQAIVEAASATVGANFEDAFSLVAGTIDDVKNAIGKGGIITPAQEAVLDKFAEKAPLFTKIAEGSGTDPAYIRGGLTQFINGSTSLKELGRLDAFSETKMTSYLAQNLQKMGVSEKTASGEQRATAFMSAIEQAFPPEMVALLGNRSTAVFARWKNFFFSQSTGLLSLNRRLKKSFGIFKDNAIDTGASAFNYFFTKLGEFFTRIARAFGIQGDPIEALAGALVSLANQLDKWATEIEAVSVDIKTRGFVTVATEKVGLLFDSIKISVVDSTSAFIKQQILPRLFKQDKLGNVTDFSGGVYASYAKLFRFTASVGKNLATFVNNTLASIPALLDNPAVNTASFGLGSIIGNLITSLANFIEGIDFTTAFKAVKAVFDEVIKPALMGAALAIDWKTVLLATLKTVAIVTLGGAALAFVSSIGVAIVGAIAGIPVLIIGALAGLGYLIITNWDSIGSFFSGIWGRAVNSLGISLTSISDWFSGLWNKVSPYVMVIVLPLVEIFQKVGSFFASVWDYAKSFAPLIIATVQGFFAVITWLFNFIVNILRVVWAVVSPILNTIVRVFVEIFNAVLRLATLTVGGFLQLASWVLSLVIEPLKVVLNYIKDLVAEVWTSIGPPIRAGIQAVANWFGGWNTSLNALVIDINAGWATIETNFKNLVTGLGSWLGDLIEKAKGWFSNINPFGGNRASPQSNVAGTPNLGTAALGNFPSWYSAVQREMSLAPPGAKPVVANDSELIVPRSQVNSTSRQAGSKEISINATFAPVINGDMNEARLFQMFNNFFDRKVTAELSAIL